MRDEAVTEQPSEDAYEKFVDVEKSVSGVGEPLEKGERDIGRVVGVEERSIENAPDSWLSLVAEKLTRETGVKHVPTENHYSEGDTTLGLIFSTLESAVGPRAVTEEVEGPVIVLNVKTNNRTHVCVYEKDSLNQNGLPPEAETYPSISRLSELAERYVPIRGHGNGLVSFDNLRENDVPASTTQEGVWETLQSVDSEISRDSDGTYKSPSFRTGSIGSLGAVLTILSMVGLSVATILTLPNFFVWSMIAVFGIGLFLVNVGYIQISKS